MALPPNHHIDHTPFMILLEDSAWDVERVNYELDVLAGKIEPEEGRPVPVVDDRKEHPWLRYHSGRTRFHLSPEILSYLDESKEPVRFELKRLSDARWRVYLSYTERGAMVEGRYYALRHGLAGIQGVSLKLRERDGEAVSEGAMGKLRRLVGDVNFTKLGDAVIRASMELLEDEKKP